MRRNLCQHMRVWVAAGLLLALGTTSGFALPVSPSERARSFATCAGYMGALAVRQRRSDPQAASETEAMRATFEALLEAVMPDAMRSGMPRAVALNWRFRAWLENTEILDEVAYSTDAGRAARARDVAADRYATCRALILHG